VELRLNAHAICFVPADELAEITKTWRLRTAIHTQELLKDANKIQRSSEREELLSAHGIRNVDVSHSYLSVHL
jgi:hypothetical protein